MSQQLSKGDRVRYNYIRLLQSSRASSLSVVFSFVIADLQDIRAGIWRLYTEASHRRRYLLFIPTPCPESKPCMRNVPKPLLHVCCGGNALRRPLAATDLVGLLDVLSEIYLAQISFMHNYFLD